MTKIKMLPNNVINQIAAGEVIERPASIVKELIENSIDAFSDNITLSIKKGGIKEIVVKDNGVGMDQEELKMAFIRHATSKVFTTKDLSKISTLGFRGEALPSIAAVSKVEAKSKIEDNISGYKLNFDFGNLINEEVTATTIGTEIKVEDLFEKIPARKKFIGTPRGESQRITEIFQNLAFSNPHISFSYYRDDNLIVKTLGDGKLKNTVGMILGNEYSKNAIPVSYNEGEYKIFGLISKPTFNQASRKKQFFFVNRRAIEDGSITHALEYGYGNLIPNGRFPFSLIFIEVPLNQVDVNVHPSKKEVRFSDKSYIHSLIVKAVKKALLNQNSATEVALYKHKNSNVKDVNKQESVNSINDSIIQHGIDYRNNSYNEKINDNYIKESVFFEQDQNSFKEVSKAKVKAVGVFDNISILGQIHSSFIIFQNKKGLAMIDQHAAHERIIYDKLNRRKESWYSQKFAVPMKISFTNIVADTIKDYINEIVKFGFEIEPFGRNSFIVRSIPNFLINKLNHQDIKDILIEAFSNKNKVSDWYDKFLIDTSCKAAIKINQSLNKQEILKLIEDLSQSNNWQYCPHGRPTVLEISFNELEKMFKRT